VEGVVVESLVVAGMLRAAAARWMVLGTDRDRIVAEALRAVALVFSRLDDELVSDEAVGLADHRVVEDDGGELRTAKERRAIEGQAG
jgi:hypothetical protein